MTEVMALQSVPTTPEQEARQARLRELTALTLFVADDRSCAERPQELPLLDL